MCGIAGIAGYKDRDRALGAVRTMVRALEHRGPDGEGIDVWPDVILGHRRLAIFDLSDAGRQPMISPDGSVAVVFNGAIYNFKTLRRELEGVGFKFKSNTDTEVLLHGYKHWGIDGLIERLRGMFAFALWDATSRSVFLARDRLGVKPLIYAERDGRLAFASSVRALKLAGLAGELDKESIAEYLEFGYVTDSRAIYDGLSKLPAASILEWRDGHTSVRSYWQPPSVPSSQDISFEDAVAETEKIFLRAVEKRLFADRPVGSLLSGGVDSSLICWAIAELGGNITAYTVSTPNDPWDESADACQTAKQLGIDHKVLEVSADEFPASELAEAYSEPFACASALGMLRVSKAVASEATVLLTGDGGDDVFLGYPEHLHFLRAQRLARAMPAAVAGFLSSTADLLPQTGLLKRASSFLQYATGGLGAVTARHDGLQNYQKDGLLGERLSQVQIRQRSIPRSQLSAKHLMEEFLEYDRKGRFVAEYMTKVDGATMRYALEARSPFLDQDLWEFAEALPFEMRLKNNRSKALLREIARRKLGGRVASGPKRGFGIPVQRWLAGRWKPLVEETFRNSILAGEDWISLPSTLNQLEIEAKNGWVSNQIWYLFVLENWLSHERALLRSSYNEAVLAQSTNSSNEGKQFEVARTSVYEVEPEASRADQQSEACATYADFDP